MPRAEADPLQQLVEKLLEATGASRVTLREERSERFFPVTHEALATGVGSIRDVEAPNMTRQPVVLEIAEGRQVVQNDCRSAFDEADFQEMLELYGGMRAQIVTPVLAEGALTGIISVHQLGSPRDWTPSDIAACDAAAENASAILSSRDTGPTDP